ncbi:MAG: hypothetical protein H6626_02045 [Pseudobdellovibrionaceae bacterium]|nr:hypothetical protein [Bdellovibrionales bacterium]USN47895.1 MAG: hypothetical protein H6626_02045 [Pseudobdellovibrionaceae bacterium]
MKKIILFISFVVFSSSVGAQEEVPTPAPPEPAGPIFQLVASSEIRIGEEDKCALAVVLGQTDSTLRIHRMNPPSEHNYTVDDLIENPNAYNGYGWKYNITDLFPGVMTEEINRVQVRVTEEAGHKKVIVELRKIDQQKLTNTLNVHDLATKDLPCLR